MVGLKPVVRHEEDVGLTEQGPFPAKILLSKKDTSIASVKLGTLEKGKKIEPHLHEECDQIEYYLKGKAYMYIEGLGQREIGKGSFTYIPRGVRHGMPNVVESLTILTVFVPALF